MFFLEMVTRVQIPSAYHDMEAARSGTNLISSGYHDMEGPLDLVPVRLANHLPCQRSPRLPARLP